MISKFQTLCHQYAKMNKQALRAFSSNGKAARPQGASFDDVDHIPQEEFKKMQDSLKKFA